MSLRKILVVGAIAVLAAAFFIFDLHHYLDLDYFRSKQAAISEFYAIHPLKSAALFSRLMSP
jgi:hypothetical protein